MSFLEGSAKARGAGGHLGETNPRTEEERADHWEVALDAKAATGLESVASLTDARRVTNAWVVATDIVGKRPRHLECRRLRVM